MKKPKAIKLYDGLKNGKLCQRIACPDDLNQLIISAKKFLKINESNKKIKLIENELNREIEDENDFKLLIENFKDKESVKIIVSIVEEKDKDIINDNVDINSYNNDDNLKEIKKVDETKYTIPEHIKNKFREKLKELGEEFLNEIEKDINNKN